MERKGKEGKMKEEEGVKDKEGKLDCGERKNGGIIRLW